MKSIIWDIGAVKVTQIIELEAGDMFQEMIPHATKDSVSQIAWLVPNFADPKGNLKALIQAFVIETRDACIVVDTCIGNHKMRGGTPIWSNLQTEFLTTLAAAGYNQDTVDIVLFTHLHFDHVGWNTMLVDGKWVPTFPKARYVIAEKEFNYWKARPPTEVEDDHAGFSDSVLPILKAGLIDLVPTDHKVSSEIALLPSHGHTPGHVSILIESDGQQALITGDVVHHPCQLAHPQWANIFDTNPEQALSTRLNFFNQFADTQTLIIGSHFASPTAGYLRRHNDTFKLVV